MNTLKIKRVRENSDLPLPHYASPGSSGLDLRADLSETVCLKPGERGLIPTGIAVEIEPGYEIQIRPRSGLAIKNGIALVNAPGTIDADYRGEIQVIMINLGQENVFLKRGDRIAQMVVAPVFQPEIREVTELADTKRGAGGFGSTGR